MQLWKGRSSFRACFTTCALLLIPSGAGAQVNLTAVGQDHVAITINGQPFGDFYIGKEYSKPFLAPLRAATGQIVSRRFPMEQVEGESRDHPHHKGFWIGFGDINGVNFWETEQTSKPSGDNPKEKGSIRLEKLEKVEPGKQSGTVRAKFAWLTAAGTTLIEEERTLVFYSDEKIRRLDVTAAFHADAALQFADTKEGFLAIRVADSMAGKNGGIITNSEGAHTEKDVWGKRADWADYVGTAEGQKLGILILDHPQNPHHPPRWHARDYGLFAANPFGEKAFDPNAPTGGFHLAPGSDVLFRYRVIIHPGDVPKKQISKWYGDFATGAKGLDSSK